MKQKEKNIGTENRDTGAVVLLEVFLGFQIIPLFFFSVNYYWLLLSFRWRKHVLKVEQKTDSCIRLFIHTSSIFFSPNQTFFFSSFWYYPFDTISIPFKDATVEIHIHLSPEYVTWALHVLFADFRKKWSFRLTIQHI